MLEKFHRVGAVAPPESSGIEVVIVGCGFGGLACAIECRRKGHNVIVLERMPTFRVLGDVISFGPNAGRIFARWGLHDRLWPVCRHADKLVIHNYLGEIVREQPVHHPLYGAYEYSGHRAEIHRTVYEYALSLGVDIRFGHHVEGYQEDSARGKANVTVNGERIEADVVIAADGVKSRARQYVLGYNDKPKSSGYSVYRAWFDAKEQGIDKDPMTDFLTKDGDAYQCWIGRDVHFICSSLQGGKTISWVITHRDEFEVTDLWSFPGDMKDVLAIVDDWDPRCAAVLSKAPACIDWKLITHDPLPTWVSPKGRVVLLGDAAHPFLPTSRQGGSQAIEDGASLAVILQIAGKGSVTLALRVWEKLRYERVRQAQLIGEELRNRWHRSQPGDRGPMLDIPSPEWLMGFDAEATAYSEYERLAGEIQAFVPDLT